MTDDEPQDSQGYAQGMDLTDDDENEISMKTLSTVAQVHKAEDGEQVISEGCLDLSVSDCDSDEMDTECEKPEELRTPENTGGTGKWNINVENIGKMTFIKDKSISEKRKEGKRNGEGKRKSKKKRI